MSTTTSFHGAAAARADRLDSGTVFVEIRDDRNTVTVFIPDRPFAEALARAAGAALDLLPAGGPS